MKITKISCQLIFSLVLFSILGCKNEVKINGEKTSYKKLKIAWNGLQAETEDDYEVFSMDTSGHMNKNISNNTSDVAWTYFADDTLLYFISDRDTCKRCYFLYVSPDEGKTLKRVSTLRLEDSWMTKFDSEHLIVSAYVSDSLRYRLCKLNVKTGDWTSLGGDERALYRDPLYIEEKKLLVFAFKKERLDAETHEELWISDDNLNFAKQLTYYPEDDTLASAYGYKAGAPHWNSSTKKITYQSLQAGKSSLYAISPEGGSAQKLTSLPFEEGWHSWSPDGKLLAVDVFDPKKKKYQIALVYEDGSYKIVADSLEINQFSPVFFYSNQ